jgi:molybdopterin-synthase adenylyltransferase
MDLFVHEEEYRGKKLLEKFHAQKIVLCGAGAIGSNMAENLVRQGFSDLSVIDFDRVENHNRHTQVWDSRSIGQLKAAALKVHLFNIMKVSITPIIRELEESNVKKYLKEGIVIDGFDNSKSRRLVTEHCRDNNIECLHIGLNTDCAEVMWNDSYRVPLDVEGLDVCEYPLARNIIMLAVVVGTESLIRFIDTGVKENYIISLGDFKITKIG